MKVTFLGTCSGTEPMPDRKHVSFVVEQGENVYWFDAGEGCSRTAHLSGVSLLAVCAIFISHTHLDHIGGLPNLLWTMAKLDRRNEDPSRGLSGKRVELFIPDLSVWRGIHRMLSWRAFPFELIAKDYRDGLIYEDGAVGVTALHNRHLGAPEKAENWRSFSFRIEAGNKSVVYSGDVADVRELEPILDGCDLLLIETGHHRVEDICVYLRDSRTRFGQLGFIHHGRAILADSEREAQKARTILARDVPGDKVLIAEDGMTLYV